MFHIIHLLPFFMWPVGSIVAIGYVMAFFRVLMGPKATLVDFKDICFWCVMAMVCFISWFTLIILWKEFYTHKIRWTDWTLRNGPDKKKLMLELLEQ